MLTNRQLQAGIQGKIDGRSVANRRGATRRSMKPLPPQTNRSQELHSPREQEGFYTPTRVTVGGAAIGEPASNGSSMPIAFSCGTITRS